MVRLDQLQIEDYEEGNLEFPIVRHECHMYKTSNSQTYRIFPHKKHPFLCYYFTLAYQFIVADFQPCDHVMKVFSKKALAEVDDSKTRKSDVANYWSKTFTQLLQMVDEFGIELSMFLDTMDKVVINPMLRSHCGKKRSAAEMAASGLYVLSIVFRCGWETRNMHTLFDYVTGNAEHDINAGKVLAGWKQKFGDGYYGGYNPSLKDISTNQDLFATWADDLFGTSHSQTLPSKFKQILACSVLRNYDLVYGYICKVPAGLVQQTYLIPTQHPFVDKIVSSMKRCGVDSSQFMSWQEDVSKAFKSYNAFAYDIRSVETDAGPVSCDPRTLVGIYKDQAKHIGDLSATSAAIQQDIQHIFAHTKLLGDNVVGLGHNVLYLHDACRRIATSLNGTRNQMDRIERKLDSILSLLPSKDLQADLQADDERARTGVLERQKNAVHHNHDVDEHPVEDGKLPEDHVEQYDHAELHQPQAMPNPVSPERVTQDGILTMQEQLDRHEGEESFMTMLTNSTKTKKGCDQLKHLVMLWFFHNFDGKFKSIKDKELTEPALKRYRAAHQRVKSMIHALVKSGMPVPQDDKPETLQGCLELVLPRLCTIADSPEKEMGSLSQNWILQNIYPKVRSMEWPDGLPEEHRQSLAVDGDKAGRRIGKSRSVVGKTRGAVQRI